METTSAAKSGHHLGLIDGPHPIGYPHVVIQGCIQRVRTRDIACVPPAGGPSRYGCCASGSSFRGVPFNIAIGADRLARKAVEVRLEVTGP